jgi:hypothetical protein
MNLRQSSFSLAPPGLERRPSVVSRLSSVFSTADQEQGNAASTGAALIEEEIAEIKRYEVSWLCVVLAHTELTIGLGLYHNRYAIRTTTIDNPILILGRLGPGCGARAG